MTVRRLLLLLIAALVGSIAGLVVGPRPVPLGPPTGDPALAAVAAPAVWALQGLVLLVGIGLLVLARRAAARGELR